MKIRVNPFDIFKGICLEIMPNGAEKVRKCHIGVIIEILQLFMVIPRRINFTQMGIYGRHGEQCYRNTFNQDFDWVATNTKLAKDYFGTEESLAIAIDPSYIAKSGDKTPGVDFYWSGCAGAMRHGLEITGVGAIGVRRNDCIALYAEQTPCSSALEEQKLNLMQWYLKVITDHKDQLKEISNRVVADAYFSTKTFADGLIENGFTLVSRFRSNAKLRYLYTGKRKAGRGRPKKLDGDIKLNSLDFSKMSEFEVPDIDESGRFFFLKANSRALKRDVALVIWLKENGQKKLFFSTDISMTGLDIVKTYKARFQIEFVFRSAKQSTGLCHCQARNKDRLRFAFNASLTTVNIAKEAIGRMGVDMSVTKLKSLTTNIFMLNRFISTYRVRPNVKFNNQIFKELFDFADVAA